MASRWCACTSWTDITDKTRHRSSFALHLFEHVQAHPCLNVEDGVLNEHQPLGCVTGQRGRHAKDHNVSERHTATFNKICLLVQKKKGNLRWEVQTEAVVSISSIELSNHS